MGFKTLNSVLNLKSDVPPPCSTYVIVDALKAKGEFMLQHFLTNYLAPEVSLPVLFVALDSIFNHHNLITRKMGLNLTQAQERKDFYFLDLASKLAFLPSCGDEGAAFNYYGSIVELVYKEILQSLDSFDSRIDSEKNASIGSIMIDDLSVLSFYGCPSSLIMRFICWLKRQAYKRGGSLIILIHGDRAFEEDDEVSSLSHQLLHLCDAWFHVSALNSGLSQDVHGQVAIQSGPNWRINKSKGGSPEFSNSFPILHYQLRDNNVAFFPKGTSQGVL